MMSPVTQRKNAPLCPAADIGSRMKKSHCRFFSLMARSEILQFFPFRATFDQRIDVAFYRPHAPSTDGETIPKSTASVPQHAAHSSGGTPAAYTPPCIETPSILTVPHDRVSANESPSAIWIKQDAERPPPPGKPTRQRPSPQNHVPFVPILGKKEHSTSQSSVLNYRPSLVS